MSVAVGVSRALAHLLPGRHLRHPRAAGARCCPTCSSGDQLGAYCLSEQQRRLRRRLDDDPRDAARAAATTSPRHTGCSGTQGVDHARRPRRLLHDLRAHVRRRRSRAVLLRRARRRRRPVVRHPRAQDGPALRHRARGDVRRRAGRRRPAHRRRGPGHGHRALGARLPAGSGSPLPQRASRSQPSTSPRPTPRSASSSAGRSPTNQGLAFLLADMEAAVTSARATYLHAARLKDAGRAFSQGGRGRQAGRHRRRHAGHHRCRAGARRGRLHPGLPGSSATCARPR